MKKYKVTIPYAVFVTVIVEADNEDQAEELAFEGAGLNSFTGNGGHDKLIGVIGSNVSIEASDEPILIDPYDINIEEVE